MGTLIKSIEEGTIVLLQTTHEKNETKGRRNSKYEHPRSQAFNFLARINPEPWWKVVTPQDLRSSKHTDGAYVVKNHQSNSQDALSFLWNKTTV